MKETDLNTELQQLETIQSADVPPFLFTRIEQRIQNEMLNLVTPKLKWALSGAVLVLFTLNVLLISKYRSHSNNGTNLAKTMQLLPNNNFYNY